ncbi:hypothetical protein T4C_4008 [Trichinella pseudospiralis]|uniref:Uncharacterized protein n=1 Tax=Trichinella pseudospiralis TaxID=6337 RepID=A0A0V1JJZ7_TRIPS|nr:hypothetical protein T4C_4008 [Trichinella pseudospiralis]
MLLLGALPKCKFLKCYRQFLQTVLSDICEKHFAAAVLILSHLSMGQSLWSKEVKNSLAHNIRKFLQTFPFSSHLIGKSREHWQRECESGRGRSDDSEEVEVEEEEYVDGDDSSALRTVYRSTFLVICSID